MSSRAPIGHLAIAGCELYTNQGCKSFVCGEALDFEFLFFNLRHRMEDIQALGSGSTFMEVSKSALEGFEISFPRIDEQRRIAAHLKAQLAAVETARQAAQVQLRDARLLSTKIVDSVFEQFENWQPIAEIAKVQSGYAFKSESFKPSGVRLLRNANILPGEIYWDDVVYLDPSEASRYPSYVLEEGDVLISLDRPLISSGIKVARVGEADLPALLLQRVGRFLLKPNEIDADFLYVFLQSSRFINAISGHDQSLGVPHISPGQVESVEIPLLPLDDQRHIVTALKQQLAEADALRAALEQQLRDLDALPQRILAQAFQSGASVA
jgi:type I restriction enzyme S subunit